MRSELYQEILKSGEAENMAIVFRTDIVRLAFLSEAELRTELKITAGDYICTTEGCDCHWRKRLRDHFERNGVKL